MLCLDEVTINCPYCGEMVSILIDCTVDEQTYIEDCEVCCQPMNIHVKNDDRGIANLTITNRDQVA